MQITLFLIVIYGKLVVNYASVFLAMNDDN